MILSDLTGADRRRLEASIVSAVNNQVSINSIDADSPSAAAAVAAKLIEVPERGVVSIVDADDTAALAALAPYAARLRTPVLLSEGGRLGEEGVAFLAANRGKIKLILAVGSTKKPALPSGYPVTEVRSSDPDQLAARLLARVDPPGAKGKLAPVVVDAAPTADVFVAATEAARRGQPLVQLRDGLLGPYSREFLVNRTAAVDGFLVLRAGGSVPPVAESALRKSVGR